MALSVPEIFSLAERGDPAASTVLDHEAALLARAIVAVVAVVDPAIVVCGGGLGSQPLLVELVQRWLPRFGHGAIDVRVSELGPAATMIGAAELARDAAQLSAGKAVVDVTETLRVRSTRWRVFDVDWSNYVVYLGFVVTFLYFAITQTEYFLTRSNLTNVAVQSAPITVMAVGMVFVLCAGEIDLSIGSVVALAALSSAKVLQDHGNWMLRRPRRPRRRRPRRIRERSVRHPPATALVPGHVGDDGLDRWRRPPAHRPAVGAGHRLDVHRCVRWEPSLGRPGPHLVDRGGRRNRLAVAAAQACRRPRPRRRQQCRRGTASAGSRSIESG